MTGSCVPVSWDDAGLAGDYADVLIVAWVIPIDDAPTIGKPLLQLPMDMYSSQLQRRAARTTRPTANDELPDLVDADNHGDLLDSVGIGPGSRLGGIGDKIGL